MKRFAIILLFLVLPLLLRAQDKRIVVSQFKADIQDARAVINAVPDNNGRNTALIDIVSTIGQDVTFEGIVGEPQYRNGNWLIRVAEGTHSIKITIPGYKQYTYSFPLDIMPQSGKVYKMDISLLMDTKLRSLISPVFSYNQSQMSFGAMLAFCKKNGFYSKAKTDFTFGITPTAECDAEGRVGGVKGWFTGKAESSRLSFTGGYIRQLFNLQGSYAMYAYVGGGYGYRTLAWEMYGADGNYEFAKVIPSSFDGYELDLGLVFRLGGLAVTAGIQTNQFKYYEGNFGFGVMF